MRVSYSAIACLALATGALALPAPLESPNPSFNLAMANAYRTIPSQPDAHIKDEGVGQAVELLSGELEGRRATGEQGGQLHVVGPSLEKRQLAAIIGILGLTAAEEAAASSSNGGSGSWEWDATDARNLGIALGCILGVPLLVGLTWCACKARKKRRERKETERAQAVVVQTPAYSTITPLPLAYLPSKGSH